MFAWSAGLYHSAGSLSCLLRLNAAILQVPDLVAVAEVAVAGMAVAGMAVAEVAVAGMVAVAEVVAEVAAGAVEVAAAAGVVVVVEEASRQAHLWAEAEVAVVLGVLPVAGDSLIMQLSSALWCVVMFSFWQSVLRCCSTEPPDWQVATVVRSANKLEAYFDPRFECE